MASAQADLTGIKQEKGGQRAQYFKGKKKKNEHTKAW